MQILACSPGEFSENETLDRFKATIVVICVSRSQLGYEIPFPALACDSGWLCDRKKVRHKRYSAPSE